MMRVDVYWNVHLKMYSIRSKGVVIGHAKAVLVRDAEFVVQPAGNAKVRATGRKVVHAFVRGHLEAWQGESTTTGDRRYVYPIWDASDRRYARAAHTIGRQVSYNPRHWLQFVVTTPAISGDGYTIQPISKSEGMVLLTKKAGRALMYDFDTLKMPEEA